MRALALALMLAISVTPAAARTPIAPPDPASTVPVGLDQRLTEMAQAWASTNHAPGLVFGIVRPGQPALIRGIGVRDVASGAGVDADTRFRIASMSKAFTAMAILKLRDEGRVALDAPVARYIPEVARWRLPTSDARAITVADLLHHTAGFVEDNPWGDRQQPLPEADFTRMLAAGVPFAQGAGERMEYSNLGYAMLGRIVTNVTGEPFQSYIRQALMQPLGMTSTGFDVFASPAGSRALGYRWQDGAWAREPDMADGTFGAMGGVETTARDYAKWVGFLLDAWPARNGAEPGPVRRATVRGIVEGANFLSMREVARAGGEGKCTVAVAYAKGWSVTQDCDLGRIVSHSGGYPGYGSIVMLLPDAGVGVFAFSNRTYGGPSQLTRAMLGELLKDGRLRKRELTVSAGLQAAYIAAKAAWASGDPARAPLAVNVALDESLPRRAAAIAARKAAVGACRTDAPITPISAMEGTFRWICERGVVAGRIQRAPTPELSLQVLDFNLPQ